MKRRSIVARRIILAILCFSVIGVYLEKDFLLSTYYLMKAKGYERKNQLQKATKETERALRVAPESSYIRWILVRDYRQSGKYDKALRMYRWLIARHPNYAGGYDGLAYCYSMKGDHAEAAEYYRRAADLNPKNAEHFYNLGYALNKLRRSEEAVKAFKKAIALKPAHTNANLLLAEVLEKLKRYDEATESLEKYLAIDTKTLETYQRLIRIGFLKRDWEFTLKYLKLGLSLAPKDPWLNYQLAHYYAKSGQVELAEKQLEIVGKMVDQDRYKKLKNIIEKEKVIVKQKAANLQILQS